METLQPKDSKMPRITNEPRIIYRDALRNMIPPDTMCLNILTYLHPKELRLNVFLIPELSKVYTWDGYFCPVHGTPMDFHDYWETKAIERVGNVERYDDDEDDEEEEEEDVLPPPPIASAMSNEKAIAGLDYDTTNEGRVLRCLDCLEVTRENLRCDFCSKFLHRSDVEQKCRLCPQMACRKCARSHFDDVCGECQKCVFCRHVPLLLHEKKCDVCKDMYCESCKGILEVSFYEQFAAEHPDAVQMADADAAAEAAEEEATKNGESDDEDITEDNTEDNDGGDGNNDGTNNGGGTLASRALAFFGRGTNNEASNEESQELLIARQARKARFEARKAYEEKLKSVHKNVDKIHGCAKCSALYCLGCGYHHQCTLCSQSVWM